VFTLLDNTKIAHHATVNIIMKKDNNICHVLYRPFVLKSSIKIFARRDAASRHGATARDTRRESPRVWRVDVTSRYSAHDNANGLSLHHTSVMERIAECAMSRGALFVTYGATAMRHEVVTNKPLDFCGGRVFLTGVSRFFFCGSVALAYPRNTQIDC
jgi:hypothetical protein